MHFNHLGLPVRDELRSQQFYSAYLPDRGVLGAAFLRVLKNPEAVLREAPVPVTFTVWTAGQLVPEACRTPTREDESPKPALSAATKCDLGRLAGGWRDPGPHSRGVCSSSSTSIPFGEPTLTIL